MTAGRILSGDNLPHLKKMAAESVALVYIDPPFNTGKIQSRKRFKMAQAEDGGREGFGGKKYRAEVVGESGYADSFSDFCGFLRPRLAEAHRILKPDGSMFFHIDWREAHRCRFLLEEILAARNIALTKLSGLTTLGARSKSRWSAKHDNIYWFAKNPKDYIFNYDEMDRIPYMAPGLAGAEKAARGKTPTDVWWNTIVPTNGREKTGYPTQKPLAILERIIKIHSRPGDLILDFFAGSGTTGEAAAKTGGNVY